MYIFKRLMNYKEIIEAEAIYRENPLLKIAEVVTNAASFSAVQRVRSRPI